MIIIQGSKYREDNIEKIKSVLPKAIVSFDDSGSCIEGFIKTLNYDISEYRLHLQDDIEVCYNLDDNIENFFGVMKKNNIDVLSLYTPNYKCSDFKLIKNIFGYAPLQGVFFSPKALKCIKKTKPLSYETVDTEMVARALFENNIPIWFHSPSLVQHLDIGSTIGNVRFHKSLNYGQRFLCK